MTDIRLMVGFLDNPKVVKLRRRHGSDAILALLRFWFYVAENKPDGDLSGLDKEDIEIACGEQSFSMHDAMLDLKFLDADEKGYRVHDWDKNQPWVAASQQRRENAQKAAIARWEKEKTQGLQPDNTDAESMQGACGEYAEGNAPNLTLPNLTKPNNKGDFFDMKELLALCVRHLGWNPVMSVGRSEQMRPLTGIYKDDVTRGFEAASAAGATTINYVIKVAQSGNIKKPMTDKEMAIRQEMIDMGAI